MLPGPADTQPDLREQIVADQLRKSSGVVPIRLTEDQCQVRRRVPRPSLARTRGKLHALPLYVHTAAHCYLFSWFQCDFLASVHTTVLILAVDCPPADQGGRAGVGGLRVSVLGGAGQAVRVRIHWECVVT